MLLWTADGQLIIYKILDTNRVKVHVVHIFLVDFQHSVSISEAAVLCRTPRIHIPDLKTAAALVHPQVEAKALTL